MVDTTIFPAIIIDGDYIPTSQTAIAKDAMAGEIDAAPAGVSYITCGVGENVAVDALPISDLAAADLNLTGKKITATDLVVKANSFTVQGELCPIPLPFGYAQCDSAGTNSTDEQNFGLGATITAIESDTDDIEWDDTNKYFVVAKAGTYELVANLIIDAGAQNDIMTIKAKVNGVAGVTIEPRIYGSVGPHEKTFQCVLTATAGQNVTISLEMDEGGTKTAHLEIGSTFKIGRLK